MSKETTPFGESFQSDSGGPAVLARLAFAGAIVAIVTAVFLPKEYVPAFVRSHYLQHFAAFYVLCLTGLAASPRARIRHLAMGLGIFSIVLESSHLIAGANLDALIANWVADVGGMTAALAPVVIDRFRRAFPPRSPR